MLNHGLLIRLESKRGLERELEAFLNAAQVEAQSEPAILMWQAFSLGHGAYAIINGFASEQARDAHISGPIMQGLNQETEALLTAPPQSERFDVLSSKLPPPRTEGALNKGLLLTCRSRAGRSRRMEQLLCSGRALVMSEPRTAAWCALRLGQQEYGMFAVFPDNGARLAHLAGPLPRRLALHAPGLLAGLPGLSLADVLAYKAPNPQ
jgi:quinol monooxygenase YgiN